MKKVLLSLLAVVLVLGVLGAAGFAGYQFGYRQGALSADGNAQVAPWGQGLGPNWMPMHNFGFDREFGPGSFGMMHRGGMGFGFFSSLMFLARIIFWGLILWAIYTLITRSGWRITRTEAVTQAPPSTTTTKTEEME